MITQLFTSLDDNFSMVYLPESKSLKLSDLLIDWNISHRSEPKQDPPENRFIHSPQEAEVKIAQHSEPRLRSLSDRVRDFVRQAYNDRSVDKNFHDVILSVLNSEQLKIVSGSFKNPKFIEHFDVFKVYFKEKNVAAIYDLYTRTIIVNEDNVDINSDEWSIGTKSTLTHELQHYVQHESGFNGTHMDAEVDAILTEERFRLKNKKDPKDDYEERLKDERAKTKAKIVHGYKGLFRGQMNEQFRSWLEGKIASAEEAHIMAEKVAFQKVTDPERLASETARIKKVYTAQSVLTSILALFTAQGSNYFRNSYQYDRYLSASTVIPSCPVFAQEDIRNAEHLVGGCAAIPTTEVNWNNEFQSGAVLSSHTIKFYSILENLGVPAAQIYFMDTLYPYFLAGVQNRSFIK